MFCLLISSYLYFMGPANLRGPSYSRNKAWCVTTYFVTYSVQFLILERPVSWGVKHSRKRDSKFAESLSTTCALIIQWNRQQRHTSSLGISVDRSEGDLPHSHVKWRLFHTIKNCYGSRYFPKSLIKRCHNLIDFLTCAVFSFIQILAAKLSSI